MQIRSDVELSNCSDVSCVREQNEDYFLYCEPDTDAEFARRGRMVVVCDGMGGCNGGEVASRIAAEQLRESFYTSEESDPRRVLMEGFRQAHQSILDEAEHDAGLRGMGTTCSAVIVHQGKLYLGHIGDSRIYLVRQGEIRQLSDDHTLVARLVREGMLTAEEAETHPQRHILTQALGVDSQDVAGDFPPAPLALEAGDIILLCSDGLHGMVAEREMALTVADQPLAEACRELVMLAKVRGGPDNITLQMLAIRQVQ